MKFFMESVISGPHLSANAGLSKTLALQIAERALHRQTRSWGARQDIFLGAVRSPWELSLSLPVGLGTRRPPTHVGARDHSPTACSAPRFSLSLGGYDPR